MLLCYQQHAKLQTTMTALKELQNKSSETRLYLINEMEGLQNRIAVLEGRHSNVRIRSIYPHINATGNRK